MRRLCSSWLSRALALTLLVGGRDLEAQTSLAAEADPPAQEKAEQADDDAVLRLAEPDYRVVNLPTTLVLPRHRGTFELTHRFEENLARGSFGSHARGLFGVDAGAVVGFEFRFGIARRIQAAAYRTSIDRTLQLHAKYDAVQQGAAFPLSISALVSVEGAENFTEDYAPALGVTVGRSFGERAAVYASPMWVHNTAASTIPQKRQTGMVGLGARVRVGATTYVVGEVVPRLGGYQPSRPEFAFGIEKRAGGHLFQLNFANTTSTTYRQLARGGSPETMFLGFNIARKFF